MSKDIFARVQVLLEQTQKKIRVATERWKHSEKQIENFTGRLQTLEGQVAILRAESMQAKEMARRGSGDHGNSGD